MTTSTSKKYYDLNTTGLGLVGGIRTESPRRGERFLACAIKALHGPRDKAEYVDYDARVVGKEAQRLILRCQRAVDAGCEVLISFRVGVRWFCIIKYAESHPKAGEIDVIQKARLLSIYSMDIDGVRVYTAEPTATRDGSIDEAPGVDEALGVDDPSGCTLIHTL
jgi:Protein of unknown function (DUF3577)